MRCPRCRRDHPETVVRCDCGFHFDHISPDDLPGWFAEVRSVLETAYTAADTPWGQSGKGGNFEEWTRLRIPISECVMQSGTFLDIGCANGFLLECLLNWTHFKGIQIIPYGLDISDQLITMAQERLPAYSEHFWSGNVWDWQPPRRFDYVRCELEYVPINLYPDLIERLLREFLTPGGRLLLAHYRSRRDNLNTGWIDETLSTLGYSIEGTSSGYSGDGLELSRIAVVRA
jgi:SAM-dependent methyltransferase